MGPGAVQPSSEVEAQGGVLSGEEEAAEGSRRAGEDEETAVMRQIWAR